jgi:hypothetical protein
MASVAATSGFAAVANRQHSRCDSRISSYNGGSGGADNLDRSRRFL